jgi:hypothetical protein
MGGIQRKILNRGAMAPAGMSEAMPRKMTQDQFVSYLESRLIPDLRESGRKCTVKDFETAIRFMRETDARAISTTQDLIHVAKALVLWSEGSLRDENDLQSIVNVARVALKKAGVL